MYEAVFTHFLETYKSYRRENGNVYIGSGCKYGYNGFGKAVNSIRNGNTSLTEEQRQTLQQLDFDFEGKKRSAPLPIATLTQLVRNYVSENGHGRIPEDYETQNGWKLGNALRTIRYGWRKISDEEYQCLLDAGWEMRTRRKTLPFEELFALLKRFTEEHHHCDVPASCVLLGEPLGSYVQNIRSGVRTLTEEQKKMLNSIGFVWNHNWVTKKPLHVPVIPDKVVPKDCKEACGVGDSLESTMQDLERVKDYLKEREGMTSVEQPYMVATPAEGAHFKVRQLMHKACLKATEDNILESTASEDTEMPEKKENISTMVAEKEDVSTMAVEEEDTHVTAMEENAMAILEEQKVLHAEYHKKELQKRKAAKQERLQKQTSCLLENLLLPKFQEIGRKQPYNAFPTVVFECYQQTVIAFYSSVDEYSPLEDEYEEAVLDMAMQLAEEKGISAEKYEKEEEIFYLFQLKLI